MLDVALLTRGSPEQLTGGHLYHRRMADRAADHDAQLSVVDLGGVPPWRNPLVATADVVLVDSLVAARVVPWVLARRRRPLAAIVHQQPGGVDHGRLRTVVQRRGDVALYRRCDAVIAPSESVAAALRDELAIPVGRVRVAVPGRDLPAGYPARIDDARAGRRIAVLCVANWSPNKGIAELVEAVAALPPDAATLHLVGRTDADAGYRDRLLQRIARPDAAGRVVVHGPLAPGDLAAWYAAADVFAMPSRSEAYGMVYAEALAAGLPVVGWRSGNLAHLIDDGVHGCLVTPGDVTGLTGALARLAADDRWRGELAEAAARLGAGLPTWDATAAAFFGALRRVARTG